MNPEDGTPKHYTLKLTDKLDSLLPNKNDTIYSHDAIKEEIERLYNVNSSDGVFKPTEFDSVVKSVTEHRDNEIKQKEEDIYRDFVRASGISNSILSQPGILSSHPVGDAIDYQRLLNDKIMHKEENLIGYLQRLNSDQIINALCEKMGRRANERLITGVREFIHRNSVSYMAEKYEPVMSLEKDGFLPKITQLLEDVPIVKSVLVLVDNLPQEASIIVKLDTNFFEDNEVDSGMDAISNIIEGYKQGNVDELEVIYHNKVVY